MEIIVIVILIMIKAIFSSSDTAFTYLNKAEINQLSKKDRKARKIKFLMENSNRFFGVIELGLNLTELFASAYVSLTILESLADKIEQWPVRNDVAIFLSAIIVTVVLAYLMLVFGGVLPKKYARNHPKKVAFKLVNIIWIISKINYPFEKLISGTIKLFSKIFNLPNDPQEKLTERQIKMIITEGREEGLIASIEKKILFNALKLDDITVKKVMKPTEKVDFINVKQTFEEILENIETFRFSRMPVYDEDINNIVGILNIKDIALEYAKNKTVDMELTHLLRKPNFIYSEEKIFDAFKKLQKEKQVLAVVKDKNEEVVGIVSLEDILEKVVGNIADEYDEN